MLRNRAPPSRATSTTLCQKCLKRGHYSYECSASTQERPYASRPSRTQQLANPKLAPKLSSDTPNDLTRKKGVADEILAATAPGHRARPRSASTASSTSVSTISTNRSRSRSPSRTRSRPAAPQLNSIAAHAWRSPPPPPSRKRRRSSLSSSSSSSSAAASSPASSIASARSDHRGHRAARRERDARNTRRRRSSTSPAVRGRRRRSSSSPPRAAVADGSRSPFRRRRSRSRDDSMDRGRIARQRTPMGGPDGSRPPHSQDDRERDAGVHGMRGSAWQERNGRVRGGGDRGRGAGRHTERERPSAGRQPLPPKKERSLSPYSRRLALTQAMNMGGR